MLFLFNVVQMKYLCQQSWVGHVQFPTAFLIITLKNLKPLND